GELVFDNWQIHHYQQAGRDINKPLKVGRDIQSLSSTTNVESTYTAIYPYATYESAPPQATEDNVDWGVMLLIGIPLVPLFIMVAVVYQYMIHLLLVSIKLGQLKMVKRSS